MGSRKGMLGGLLLIIGAILLVVALLTSWYSFTITESATVEGQSLSGSVQTSLYPGSDYKTTTSGYFGGNTTTCPYAGTTSTSGCSPYARNQTGALYSVAEFLTIGGLVLGLLAGILALMTTGRPGMRKGAMALGILALLLALVTPMVLLAGQPAAIKNDEAQYGGHAPTNGSGPDTSFFGSCSGSSCEGGSPAPGVSISGTWGPSTGWYLSIGAFVVFLLGILIVRGAKGQDAMPAPAPAAPADSSMPSNPPANPPMGSS
ncbi:MAG: hypothetical protein L3K04_01865 [Thermoplasmata archaeon]|nr:hypothetical protein [Thermoplasmata archaeon]